MSALSMTICITYRTRPPSLITRRSSPLKGDTALEVASCKIMSAGAATMVDTYVDLVMQPTIDSFTERPMDTTAFAAGLTHEPEKRQFRQ